MKTYKASHQFGNNTDKQPSWQAIHPENEAKLFEKQVPCSLTRMDKLASFFKPYLAYVFTLRPVIPNLIYVAISVGVMQITQVKGFFPEVDWLQPLMFYGLLAGISIQLLFASAKSITVPLAVMMPIAWVLWASTNQGLTLPLSKEILQYLMVVCTAGVVLSSAMNP